MKSKGPKFNIPAFPEIGEAINSVVDWVESLPPVPEFIAGPNVLVSSDENTITIESAAVPEPTEGAGECTFKFGTKDCTEDDEPVCTLYALGGAVNGLFPTNYDDIGKIKSDAEKFLYLDITTGNTGILTMDYKLEDSVKPLTPQYAEGAPPTRVEIFIGRVKSHSVNSNYCNGISMRPEIAYVESSSASSKTFYYWSIS